MAAHRPPPDAPPEPARLDKWLWHARFFRTRTLASDEVSAGHVRLNGVRTTKPGHVLRVGDTLTFPQGGRIRLIRVTDTALRRGPAVEARRLYLDLDTRDDASPSALEGPPSFD